MPSDDCYVITFWSVTIIRYDDIIGLLRDNEQKLFEYFKWFEIVCRKVVIVPVSITVHGAAMEFIDFLHKNHNKSNGEKKSKKLYGWVLKSAHSWNSDVLLVPFICKPLFFLCNLIINLCKCHSILYTKFFARKKAFFEWNSIFFNNRRKKWIKKC